MYNNTTNGTVYYIHETIDFPAVRIIDIFILLATILGNTTVIVILAKLPDGLRSSLNYLILNLSICSILFVVTSIPFELVLVVNKYHYVLGPVGCRVIGPLATMSTNASVFTLLCITIERYVAIVHPLFRYNPRKHVLKVIGATYIYSLITVMPLVFYKQYRENEYGYKSCKTNWSVKSKQAYTVALFLLQYGIPLPVMVVLYSRAWIALKQHNNITIQILEKNRDINDPLCYTESEFKRIREAFEVAETKPTIFKFLAKHFDFLSGHGSSMGVTRQRRKQTTKTLIIFTLIIFIFAISFLPNQIFFLWYAFYPDTLPNISDWLHVFIVLHYSNCVLNPIVYGGLNWRGYGHVLCCVRLNDQPRSSTTMTTRSSGSSYHSWGRSRTSSGTVSRQMELDFEGGILTRNPVNVISVYSSWSSNLHELANEAISESRRKISKKHSTNSRSKFKLSLSPPDRTFRKLTLPLLSTTSEIEETNPNKHRKLSVPVQKRKKRSVFTDGQTLLSLQTHQEFTSDNELATPSIKKKLSAHMGIKKNRRKKSRQPIPKESCLALQEEVQEEFFGNRVGNSLSNISHEEKINTEERPDEVDSSYGTLDSSTHSINGNLTGDKLATNAYGDKPEKSINSQINRKYSHQIPEIIFVDSIPTQLTTKTSYLPPQTKNFLSVDIGKISRRCSSSEQLNEHFIATDVTVHQKKRHLSFEDIIHSMQVNKHDEGNTLQKKWSSRLRDATVSTKSESNSVDSNNNGNEARSIENGPSDTNKNIITEESSVDLIERLQSPKMFSELRESYI